MVSDIFSGVTLKLHMGYCHFLMFHWSNANIVILPPVYLGCSRLCKCLCKCSFQRQVGQSDSLKKYNIQFILCFILSAPQRSHFISAYTLQFLSSTPYAHVVGLPLIDQFCTNLDLSHFTMLPGGSNLSIFINNVIFTQFNLGPLQLI